MTRTNTYFIDPTSQQAIAKMPSLALNIPSDNALQKQLKSLRAKFAKLQRKLYAHDKYSLLLIFQAMDAAGKDSTIRSICKGVNPAGFQVSSFKQPSKLELDHDFLWRSAIRLPERGKIGIFNRSYYEETLVVRVHPSYLDAQKLPSSDDLNTLWQTRYQSIVEHERHLSQNGTVILKFWLNVSRETQKQRFLDRLNNPKKHWKFSSGDLKERALWPDYMNAYQDMLNATSTDFAPWYAIPADHKLWMQTQVASVVVEKLKSLDLSYPTADTANFQTYKSQLLAE